VVRGNPSLFGFSVPRNLEDKLAFYCQYLEITPTQVRWVRGGWGHR
jgi:hypothetical protein